MIDIALGRLVWIDVQVGVYRARCGCCKYFQAWVPGIPARGKYTLEVRNVVANALVRDRMPYPKVQERMLEEYDLKLSLGFLHECFRWAHEQIDLPQYRQWIQENFSGVLCIDEVHDGNRVLLFATDPMSDVTVSFAVNGKNDQEHMDAFLKELQGMGIEPEVVITDGSGLYKSALQEVWEGVEHQLCIFHVIKEINKLVLDALREEKNRLRRRANRAPKKKRGPKRKGWRKRSRGPSLKEQAKFLWKNQHLIVKRYDRMSAKERKALGKMYRIAPEAKMLRRFSREFYKLFERGISRQTARRRRERMACREEYRKNPFLKRALKKLRPTLFEKMIVFLTKGEKAERTSNHVERNNRGFRMMQKTRYKRRTARTVRMMIELDLYARMLRHPRFKPREDIPLATFQTDRKEAA